MTENQKLLEALRIAVNYIDMDALYTSAGGDHDTIKEALALPTADEKVPCIACALRDAAIGQTPDSSVTPEFVEWVKTKSRSAGVAANEAWNAGVAWASSKTAAPVGERELPPPFGYVSDGAPDGLRFQHKPWPDVHALINSVMPVYSQAQMQAALSAGDSVDGLPGMEPVAWLISVPDEPDLGSWLSEEPGADYCKSEPLCAAAAVQQYKEDAERLDFLDALCSRPASSDMHMTNGSVALYVRTGVGAQLAAQGHGKARDAIDAAMRKGQL